MDMSAINWFAVLTAGLVGFPLGYLWYGPLFGNPWMASIGLTKERIEHDSNMVRIFGISLLCQLIMSFCLAMFFYGDPTQADTVNAVSGGFYGFLTGFGWVAMVIAVTSQFEQRSFTYVGIVGSYWTVQFTIMGVILGAWQ